MQLPSELALTQAQVDYYTGLSAQPPTGIPGGASTEKPADIGSAGSPSVTNRVESAWQWLEGGAIRTALIVFLALMLLSFFGVIPWRFWLVLVILERCCRRVMG